MKVRRIRKAEKWEADHFRKFVDDTHPLEYVAETDTALDIMIEGLHEGPGEPQYEAMAPDGFHFDGDMVHSLICFSLKDVRERLTANDLEKCNATCGG